MISYDEMIADVEELMLKACDDAGADYDEFVAALDDAFDARFEIMEM